MSTSLDSTMPVRKTRNRLIAWVLGSLVGLTALYFLNCLTIFVVSIWNIPMNMIKYSYWDICMWQVDAFAGGVWFLYLIPTALFLFIAFIVICIFAADI